METNATKLTNKTYVKYNENTELQSQTIRHDTISNQNHNRDIINKQMNVRSTNIKIFVV